MIRGRKLRAFHIYWWRNLVKNVTISRIQYEKQSIVTSRESDSFCRRTPLCSVPQVTLAVFIPYSLSPNTKSTTQPSHSLRTICSGLSPPNNFKASTKLKSYYVYSSFNNLSDDRSKASSKTMPPHSAIQSFLLQMRVSSPVLKFIQQLLTSFSSSSCHFHLPLYLSFDNLFQKAVST